MPQYSRGKEKFMTTNITDGDWVNGRTDWVNAGQDWVNGRTDWVNGHGDWVNGVF